MKRILLALMLVPVPLVAQTRTVVSAYMGADATLADEPLMVGLTAARETGPLAARLSAAFDVSSPPAMDAADPFAPAAPPQGLVSSDLDVLLYIGNPRGSGPIVPYLLGGLGLRAYDDGGFGAAANYSYGAGFRAPLGGGFGFEGEIRHRDIMGGDADAPSPAVASGLEYRAGLSVGFGGRARLGLPLVPPAPVRGLPATLPTASIYTGADAPARFAAAMLSTAERYIGTPYVWGGNTPQGFDCSGFIRFVFAQQGLSVPRVSRDQARFGTALPLDITHFQPGDVLAFASDGRTVDHTAIYAGNGRIIHSSSSGNGVRYDDLYSHRGAWYVEHMVAARRVLDTYAGL